MDLEGGDGGGDDPREILPTEMWLPILENLVDHPDPRDLIAASESCSLFADILSDHVNSHRLAEVTPLLLQWLDHKDRLNCRCVSKRVSRSVDSIMDHMFRVAPSQNLGLFKSRFMPPPQLSRNFENTHFSLNRICAGTDWRTRKDVERFDSKMAALSAIGSGSTHPIVGRTLCLTPFFETYSVGRGRLEPERIFLEECIQRLPDYRDALGHVILVGCTITGTLIDAYDICRRILTALPNLYFLRDIGGYPSEPSRVAERVTNLGLHIAGNPMPAMHLLEEISLIESSSPVPAPLLQEISTRYGGQLKRLRTAQGAGVPESGDVQDLVTFPELTHLSMMNCQEDHHKLPPIILMNVQADNLVNLTLSIGMRSFTGDRYTGSMLPEVVQYLARFPRLIRLHLNMTYLLLNGMESRMILAGVQYPSVKELKVNTQHCQLPLAFFTELFPNLESFRFGGYLKTNYTGLEYGEFQEDFQLLMSERGFECEVWERCPSLKRLRFRSDHDLDSVYCRDACQKNGSQSRSQQHLRK